MAGNTTMCKTENSVSMTLQELLDNGVRCYQEQNYKGAVFYFEHYLLHDKNNAEVLHVLAQLKCELKDYKRAVALAVAASELCPESNEYRFTLAESLFLNQELLKAEVQYISLKEELPLNTHILDRLILIYQKQKKFISEKQIKTIKRDVEEKIDPLQSELVKTISVAKELMDKGSLGEARVLLESVLSLSGNNLHANGLLALSYINECDYKKAVGYFDKIKDNLSEDYYSPYTYVIERVMNKESALPILDEAVQLYPENDKLRLQLAILCFNLNKYQRAYKEITKVLDPKLQGEKYFMVKSVSNLLSIEERGKWINLDALNASAKALKEAHDKYPDNESISFHLLKYYHNIGEFKKSYDILCESNFSDAMNKEWNKHPYYMAKRDRDSFFKSYLCGHAQRVKLPFENLNGKIWKGESLENKNVVILREQGIGDELLFAHNYNWIIKRAKSVSIFCSERLKKEFSRIFPDAKILPMSEQNGALIYSANTQPVIFLADTIIFSGDTPAYCYQQLGRPLFDESYYKVDKVRKDHWQSRINNAASDLKKPKVGLIWRSGSIDGLRSAHYLSLDEVVKIVSSVAEVDFFNCMYVECNKEINYIQKKSGRKIHNFDDLDQKNDFKDTAAMLSCLDLLVGAYTATVSLSIAVGTDTLAYCSDYLSDDGNIQKEPFYYKSSSHISLPVTDLKKREEAINSIIKIIKEKFSYV